MSQPQELSPAGSIERDEDSNKGDNKKVKSRRPPNTAFRQQRLKAWQPILTPKTVLPLFFCVGIIFAPIGGLLLWASDQVQEISIDYSACGTLAPTGKFSTIPSSRVSSSFSSGSSSSSETDNNALWRSEKDVHIPIGVSGKQYYKTNVCTLQFDIPNDIGPPVLMYYRLTNFYQNHRRYVKSLDQEQLAGDFISNSSVSSSDCDPLTTDHKGFAYYPCGLIANSLFNDTIYQPLWLNVQGNNGKKRADRTETNETYAMTTKGIGWSSDASLYGKTSYKPDQVVPPPFWKKRYPQGYNDEFPLPAIHEDEAFWVWMRTAGLPTFSKLARRNDTRAMFAGTYQLRVSDEFPVEEYGGTKEILISTRTVMGGKNPYLGIAYIVVGGICILLGAIFTATHLFKPRRLGDHTYLTWNNDQPSAATTTGRSLRNDNA